MKCLECFHYRESRKQLSVKWNKIYTLLECCDCGNIILIKNSVKDWVSRSPYGKWHAKRKGFEMIELFGYSTKTDTKGMDLKEVSIIGNKNDITKLRDFLNICLEEIKDGSFTGKNGGHRHFSFYTNDIKSKTDIVIVLNPEDE